MLVREIEETEVGPGELALWWLGQSGFAVKGGNLTLYLDPYLSTRLERLTENSPRAKHVRLCPIPVSPEKITNAYYVICSHDHGDHLDPETLAPIAGASPDACFVVPCAAKQTLISLGISPNRIAAVGADEVTDLNGLRIIGVPGKHNEFDWRPGHGYPYLGYLITLNGLTIYHAGDTVFYDGFLEHLAGCLIDIALLPINGGDADRVERGFMSNLNYREAADLGAAIGARLIVPTHYGMFDINNERVEKFIDYIRKTHPEQRYHCMALGERFVYAKARVDS